MLFQHCGFAEENPLLLDGQDSLSPARPACFASSVALGDSPPDSTIQAGPLTPNPRCRPRKQGRELRTTVKQGSASPGNCTSAWSASLIPTGSLISLYYTVPPNSIYYVLGFLNRTILATISQGSSSMYLYYTATLNPKPLNPYTRSPKPLNPETPQTPKSLHPKP